MYFSCCYLHQIQQFLSRSLAVQCKISVVCCQGPEGACWGHLLEWPHLPQLRYDFKNTKNITIRLLISNVTSVPLKPVPHWAESVEDSLVKAFMRESPKCLCKRTQIPRVRPRRLWCRWKWERKTFVLVYSFASHQNTKISHDFSKIGWAKCGCMAHRNWQLNNVGQFSC